MSARRTTSVILGIAWRNLFTTMKTPSLAVPPVMVPLFTLMAIGGGLSAVQGVPLFDFDGDYTAFMFIFVMMQSATMCGQFTALALARDFETGFARRLMLTAPRRWHIVAGYSLAALGRTLVTVPLLFVVGIVFGMEVNGNIGQVLAVVGLSLLVSVVTAFWSMGVALRLRTSQAAPLMMLPIFATLFAASAFVPLAALSGWLHNVASVNPVTAFLEAGRGLISGHPQYVAPALVVGTIMFVVLGAWSFTGLRRAEAAGGVSS